MDTQSCSYATPVSRKKNQSQGESSPDDMQNRIDRLEGLVLSLMHGGANIPTQSGAGNSASASQSVTDSGGSSGAKLPDDQGVEMVEDDEEDGDSDIDQDLSKSLGVLKVDTAKGKSMYFGQESWHTILADISEVKQYFSTHKKELESSYERVRQSKPMTAREGPTLLLGAVPASEIELRAELPPKTTVLTLCSRYFNSMDNAVSIIHGPTFQQQLKTHWQDPSKTPITWLGMLYAIMCLAMLSYHKVGDEPPEWKNRSLEMASEFRLRTVQCLIKADYTKPAEYTIETMILYIFGEHSSRWDADLGLWMVTSLIIRIAFRMGYHRDAKWFPSITPFQAEMRRRTWALVRMADVMFSNKVSLPNMIYEHDCDTQLPTNIFDDEFHPLIKELPPGRPSTEPTPIAYMIAKARLCNEAGNVLHAVRGVGKHVTYDEIIRFDAKLRQIKKEIAPHLKLTPLEGSHDPVTLIIARFNVEVLYLMIMCMLHRKYLPRARHNPRYAHSRRTAIESALQALDHLATLHRESQGYGRLRSVDWYIKSIATSDFTIPAMLVILDLHYDNLARQESTPEGNSCLYTQEERDSMIKKVEHTKDIWLTMADSSMEAFKGSKVIEIMLEKIKDPSQATEPMAATGGSIPDLAAGSVDPTMSMPPNILSPGTFAELSAGMDPFAAVNTSSFMGMDFNGMGPSTASTFSSNEGFNLPGAPSPMAMYGMGGLNGQLSDMGTSNIDWNMFENFTQAANWGPDQNFQIYGNAVDESSPDQPGSEQRSSVGGGSGNMRMDQ
jgi:hypothetical protein